MKKEKREMEMMTMQKEKILSLLSEKCMQSFGCDLDEATKQQTYRAVCLVVRDLLVQTRNDFCSRYEKQQAKQVYYIAIEILVGTYLHNNL